MDADKERLARMMQKSITKVFKDSLALIEMTGIEKNQFDKVRKLILRSGNDEIRKVMDELDKYDVSYYPRYDEHIDFEE